MPAFYCGGGQHDESPDGVLRLRCLDQGSAVKDGGRTRAPPPVTIAIISTSSREGVRVDGLLEHELQRVIVVVGEEVLREEEEA